MKFTTAWRWSISAPFPFQLAANDLGVVITYAPASGHYLGEIACSDITAQQAKAAAVRSKLDLSVELAPDAVDLKTLHFTTEKTSLQASGSLAHFAHPQWTGTADGTVDLAEVTALGVVDGFRRGSVDLALTAAREAGAINMCWMARPKWSTPAMPLNTSGLTE